MPPTYYMNVHPFLLIGVYLKRIFSLTSEYWTHIFSFEYKSTIIFVNMTKYNRKSKYNK